MESYGSGDSTGMNVVALIKNGERYVFLYDDKSDKEMLRTLGRYAADPELSLNFFDAAYLTTKVKELFRQRTETSNEF